MRKEKEITITEGRDAGKTFKITEMSATQADRWATKALCLVGKSGCSIVELFNKISTGGILNILGDLGYDGAEPLMEELLNCCSFKKDGVDVQMKGTMVDSVIEDWTTIFRLRKEALDLTINFLEQGGESKSD